jgi:hypothetical protein
MRKETKNPCPTAAVRREGKTLPVLPFRQAGKLLPALAYCSFFWQSRQSPFAEKLRNSPFTQLQARRFAVPPHVAHGKLLGFSKPFCFEASGTTTFSNHM